MHIKHLISLSDGLHHSIKWCIILLNGQYCPLNLFIQKKSNEICLETIFVVQNPKANNKSISSKNGLTQFISIQFHCLFLFMLNFCANDQFEDDEVIKKELLNDQ